MEIPLQTLAYELSFFGIDLKQYLHKQVIYVEQVGCRWYFGIAEMHWRTEVADYLKTLCCK